jgi:hypothetical protein
MTDEQTKVVKAAIEQLYAVAMGGRATVTVKEDEYSGVWTATATPDKWTMCTYEGDGCNKDEALFNLLEELTTVVEEN